MTHQKENTKFMFYKKTQKSPEKTSMNLWIPSGLSLRNTGLGKAVM